jgi:hypothetical protein
MFAKVGVHLSKHVWLPLVCVHLANMCNFTKCTLMPILTTIDMMHNQYYVKYCKDLHDQNCKSDASLVPQTTIWNRTLYLLCIQPHISSLLTLYVVMPKKLVFPPLSRSHKLIHPSIWPKAYHVNKAHS